MLTNDDMRHYLGSISVYKDLAIISKFDTATLTVKDLYNLERAAHQRGYIEALGKREFNRYGLE